MDASHPDLSYPEIGATAGELPTGYHHVRRGRLIGSGPETLDAAADVLLGWDVHRRAGLGMEPDTARVTVGTTVRQSLAFGPLRFTAPCRVIEVFDEPRRRGFVYGTLAGHPEAGEERFELTLLDDDRVRFQITAFWRANRWYSRLGGPVVWLIQRAATTRYLKALP
jgi:uncharacterized protein (UPF0548 family)